MILKELIFNSFYFGEGVVILKELILTVSSWGHGGTEGSDFNSFYYGMVW